MDLLLSQSHPGIGWHPSCTANSLYALARKRARQGQFRSSLTGRSRRLFALQQVRAECTILAESDGDIRTVPISQIRGSEGRCRYFDSDFNPLYDQAQGRWLSIARARQQGQVLPVVVLIQVGDIYFVRDGHHRISVARAMGQTEIEASVTTWQVSGPLPWQATAETPQRGLTHQLLDVCHAFVQRGFQGLFSRARSASGSAAGG